MSARPSAPPPSRARTVREELREALREGPATARELSSRVGVREREVAEHLDHLARSLASGPADGGRPDRGREGLGRVRAAARERLALHPAACLACGYVFRGRSRLSRPSACPRCRGTHIEPPAFRLERRGA